VWTGPPTCFALLRELGLRASVFRADVAHEDQVQALVTDVLREFGRLDILVNNAGRTAWFLSR
jgi:3-oxoacyl-[acyl-carrier protein] reductase